MGIGHGTGDVEVHFSAAAGETGHAFVEVVAKGRIREQRMAMDEMESVVMEVDG